MNTPDAAASPHPAIPFGDAVAHLREGFVVTDATRPGNPIVSVNPAFLEMTGYAEGEALGRNCSFLQGPGPEQPEVRVVRAALRRHEPVEAVLRNRRKSGRPFLNHLRIAPVRGEGGGLTHFIGFQRDVTEEVLLRRQLRQRNQKLRSTIRALKATCLTDELTGLGNRRAFTARLGEAWAASLRSGAPLSVLMVDVDWFKNYNDHHGHPAGDAALRRVAGVLDASIRRGCDSASRYGGEEFALLGVGMPGHRAGALARKLCRRVHRARLVHGDSPLGRLTVSVGHATAHAGAAATPGQLVTAADRALYAAKAAGRNRSAADPALSDPARRGLTLTG